MPTINELAKHVVIGESVQSYPILKPNENAKAYPILMGATTPDIIQRVRDFVKGKNSFEQLEKELGPDNAYSYLAAAKVVDMDTPPNEMINTTSKIRGLCVLQSKKTVERNEINMINAFSTPPKEIDNVDILLANELDHIHPIVNKAPFGNQRNVLLTEIYNYSQYKASITPEMASLIKEIMIERYKSLMEVGKQLPEKTFLVFKGSTGTGTSEEIQKFISNTMKNQFSLEQLTQNTETVKKIILNRTKGKFTEQQAHLLAHTIHKLLMEVTKKQHPKLSTLQEGWFNSSDGIKNLFKSLDDDMKLEIRDYDGDFLALCLKVLSASNQPEGSKPPFDRVMRGFKTSRESRPELLQALRPQDKYSFHFINDNGVIDDKKDPRSLSVLPTEVDKEIEKVKSTVITEDHIRIFGKFLTKFLNLTIADAFKKMESEA